MTDIEKIRAEIERRYNEYMAKDSELAAIRADECLDILSFIDSMQEEPVSKLWHDASENPSPNKELICVGEFKNPLVLSSNSESFKKRNITKWAYFDDLLHIDKKEPVSEDLEKEIEKMWAQESKCRDTDYTIAELTKQDYEDCAIHFSNWQQQQMTKKAIDGQLENGEDYLRIKCLSMGCQQQDDGKLVKLIIIREGLL